MLSPLFAQIILNQADQISQLVANSWDSLWQDALNGSLYVAINNVGVFFAVITLLFWLSFWYKELHENGNPRPLTELIWPILVVVLLANGGNLLRELTISQRDLINTTNTNVLSAVSASIRAEQTLAELANFSTVQNSLLERRKKCDTITNNEEMTVCLEEVRAEAQRDIDAFRSTNPGAAWLAHLENLRDQLFSPPTELAAGVVRILQTPSLLVVEALMIALQAAFQGAVEVAMLLTALLGPIAVGGSLLPIGAPPLYAWLTGFWSLGICKLCLNIITGLIATAIHRTGPTDTLSTAITLGLLSPVLALGLSAGGGMAIFSAITAAATAAMRTGINIGLKI